MFLGVKLNINGVCILTRMQVENHLSKIERAKKKEFLIDINLQGDTGTMWHFDVVILHKSFESQNKHDFSENKQIKTSVD